MSINNIFRGLVNVTHIAKEPVICGDGFQMSVQASSFHYCSPRIDGADHYEAFEIGFPSEAEPLLTDYAEDKEDLTGTVYGWVPADVIDAVIAKHGGVKEGAQ